MDKKFLIELSNRLADEPDYENELLPKFEKSLKAIEISNIQYSSTYTKDHVCKKCNSPSWHLNIFYHNGNKTWFEGEDEYGNNSIFCHSCNDETELHLMEDLDE